MRKKSKFSTNEAGDPESDHKAVAAESNDSANYRVGYGKPPLATRFKKGVSGNPRGPRPGNRSLKPLFLEELNSRITIVERGVRKTLTKREALVKQVVNKGLADPKVGLQILQVDAARAAMPGEAPSQAQSLSSEEHDLLKAYLERLKKMGSGDEA